MLARQSTAKADRIVQLHLNVQPTLSPVNETNNIGVFVNNPGFGDHMAVSAGNAKGIRGFGKLNVIQVSSDFTQNVPI